MPPAIRPVSTYAPDETDEFLDWEAGALARPAQRLGPEQREAVRRHLQHAVPPALLDYFSTDPTREAALTSAIRAAFEKNLVRATRQHPLPHVLTPDFVRAVYDDVIGLGPLEPLLRDPQVTSVSVLDWRTLLVERGHERERHAETFRDQAHLEQVADNLAVLSGYTLTLKVRPRMTHFSLVPPSRLHIDISSANGPFIGFRRGRAQPWPLEEFVRRGSLSLEAAEFLRDLARAEVPMLIVGPPGAGKTTLLEALLHELPQRHLVTIEDGAFELHPDHPYVTHVVVPPRADDEAGHTTGDMAEAAKSALRKNADQVVYGEIMDGNAGHVISNASSFRFSATTLHGHTIEAALARFAILAQLDNTSPRSPYVGLDNALVRADLTLGFKAVVLCDRLADDRQVVRAVAWLDGLDDNAARPSFRLTELVTLVETVTPSGIQARWETRSDWTLPGLYAVNLQAADLAAARRLAHDIASGAVYQQALSAVHGSDWERATALLLQALQSTTPTRAPLPIHTLPSDVTALLQKVLQRTGAWATLGTTAVEVVRALDSLHAARRWDALDQALTTLDTQPPLALAVHARRDLRALRHALAQGRARDAAVAARLETASRLARAGRHADALALLLAPGTPLDTEHERALARTAADLFDSLHHTLAPAPRALLRSQLAALAHRAGFAWEGAETQEATGVLAATLAAATHVAGVITHLETSHVHQEPTPHV